MRRFIKPALVTLGAAAATFAVVAGMGSPLAASPAAKASTFCEPATDAQIINPVPFDIPLPTLPSIPPINTEIPCIELPTMTEMPPLPTVSLPPITLPSGPTFPSLHELLGNIPTEIDVPIPNFHPTTTTTNPCEFSVADAVVPAAC